MDIEDRDHFKTIASQSVAPLTDWPKRQNAENSSSEPDPAYSLQRAKILFSCYRKDEVHDPEIYAAAVASVLAGYSRNVIDRVTDPRTGIASELKFLPSIAEITEFCEVTARRIEVMAAPRRKAIPFVPPPLKPGEITYGEFLKRCAEDGLKPRPIGASETGGYLG